MSKYELNTKSRFSTLVLSLTAIVSTFAVVGCMPTSAESKNEFVVLPPPKQTIIRTVCYEGILYFTDWTGSASHQTSIQSPVIDQTTKQPKSCSRSSKN